MSEPNMLVGVSRPSGTTLRCREAERNVPQQVFEKLGWGKVNPCKKMFASRRPRETRHILGLVLKAKLNDSSLHVGAVKLRETYPTSFWETRLRESKPRSKFVWVQKAEGNEAHTWLGSQGQVKRLFSTCWCREAEGNVPQQVFEKPGWGKVNHVKFGSRRPRETRHIFGWALKAEWNDSSVHVGAVKLREMNPTSFWETRLSKSKPRSNFVWFT